MDSLGENVRKGGSTQYNILRTFREWEEASDSVREAERWSEVKLDQVASETPREERVSRAYNKSDSFADVQGGVS